MGLSARILLGGGRQWEWEEGILALRTNEAEAAQRSVDNENKSLSWTLNEPRSSPKQVKRNNTENDVPKRKNFW